MHSFGPRTSVTIVLGSLIAFTTAVTSARADQAPTAPVAPATAPARTVGNLGDTHTLQFEGPQLFTPVQLRTNLECDLRYQAAARPSADLDHFLRVVEERLLAGYHYCGCPDAKVHATCDDQRGQVHVQIEEGGQNRKGQVEVAAPQQIDRTAIVRCLTTMPQARPWKIERDDTDLAKPVDDSIVWKSGEPVNYDELSADDTKATIRRALAEQGFARAKFNIGLGARDNAGNVNLRVEVENTPEPDRIRGIEIIGLKRNSRQELLQFLHVAEGEPLNAALLERVYNDLKGSCRFWQYKVSAVIPGEKPSQDSMVSSVGHVLKLELDEYAEVPPLGKPLSEIDEVLRKAGLLLASGTRSHDFVVEASRLEDATSGIKAVRMVVGGDGRASLEVLSAAKGAWNIDHALLLSPGALEIYDWKAQQKYVSPLPKSMAFSLSVKPSRGDNGECQLSAVVGGAKAMNGDDATRGPWQIQIEPVAVVHLAHRKDGKRPKIAIRNGELTYSEGLVNLRLDAATGRLNELKCTAGTWIKRDFLNGRLEQGAFDKTAVALRAQGQAYRNCYDETHKIGSGWDFTLAQIEKQPIISASPELTMYCRLARQLRSSQTLALLYHRWVELTGVDYTDTSATNVDRCRQFNIPQISSPKEDQLAATIDNSLVGVPAMADLMFARNTWPWTISREACFWKLREFLYGDQKEQASALAENEFRRMAGGVGPLGALALAQSMKQLDSADARQTTAISNWGISMLSQDAFAKDVSLVTEGDSGLALICRAATEQLGKLSEEEQEAIIELLPDEFKEPAARIARRRKEHPAEPAGATIQATLVESWNNGLRDVVQADLREAATAVAKKPDAPAAK